MSYGHIYSCKDSLIATGETLVIVGTCYCSFKYLDIIFCKNGSFNLLRYSMRKN